jgi:cell wall-associated NlpC family hydrolase
MITAADIEKKYLGLPFKDKGRDLTGLDCYGLASLIYKEVGIEVIDLNDYFQLKRQLLENYYKQWEKVSKPAFLDIVFFLNGRGHIEHCGIMLDGLRFIHSVKGIGVVITKLGFWKETVEGFYRHKR